jgi:hypothetical protein
MKEGGRSSRTAYARQVDALTPPLALREVAQRNCWRKGEGGRGVRSRSGGGGDGGRTVPTSVLHTGHVTVTSHTAADRRRTGATLQPLGSPAHTDERSLAENRGLKGCAHL